MTLSTSTITLAPGSSRTYSLAPGEAVTVATEPNCYVTVTETPDVITSADLDGQTNVRTSILQYKGSWTYGPYALGGTVVVAVSSTKSTSSVSATLGSAAAAVVGASGSSGGASFSAGSYNPSAIASAMQSVFLFWDVPLQTGCQTKPIFLTYIDAINGDDSAAGTYAAPKRTAVVANWTGSKTSWFSNEMLLFRAGQTHTLTATGTSIGLTTTKHLGAYWKPGDNPLSRPTIKSLNDTGAAGANSRAAISASGTLTNIIVRDIILDVSDVPNRHGLHFYQTADGQTITNISIINVDVIGGTITDAYAYTGIAATYFGQYARLTPYGTSKNILIANCNVLGYPGHGIGVFGTFGENLANGKWHGVDVINCASVGNGAGYDTHAFSSYSGGVLLDWSSASWTNTTSTIYWHDIDSRYGRDIPSIDVVFYQQGAGGEVFQLVQNTATPTTPSVGEYGFDVGTTGAQRLYVNINAVVSATQIFSTAVVSIKGIRYIRCLATNQLRAGRSGAIEGHGFAFDDMTSNCAMIECTSIGNAGHGVTLNRGNGISVIGCDIHGNGLAAVKANFGWSHVIAKSALSGAGFSDTVTPFKGLVHLASASHRSLPNTISGGVVANCSIELTGVNTGVVAVLGATSGNAPIISVEASVFELGVGSLQEGRVQMSPTSNLRYVPATVAGLTQ
jgi:hypothetical protein